MRRRNAAALIMISLVMIGSAPARDQQVNSLMQRGRFVEAESLVHEKLNERPASAELHSELGKIYVAEKKFDLAEKEFRFVLREQPDNPAANYDLGVLLLAKGSAAEAIPFLERVRPADVAASSNLIRAYLETDRTQKALRLATELSTRNQDNVQLHFTLGILLASEKQYKAAEVELERAETLQPGTFEIIYNLGQAFFRGGDSTKAEPALERALKLQPDSVEALSLLARVQAVESRPMDALSLLVKAHKAAPQNTDVTYLMAQISMSQHYYEDAIPLLESGLAIAPQRTDLRVALGESYLMADKVDRAVEELKAASAATPSPVSYVMLGLCYQRLGRFEDAKQAFEQALKLDPHNASCLFHLGFIEERQGDRVRAAARFLEVLRLSPDFPEALLELASLRSTEKNFSGARDLLRKYVQVSPHPATGYYKLAMAERSMHETVAADRDLRMFQTLSRGDPGGQYPNEHLFDYLDSRSKLPSVARNQQDIADINEQLRSHPNQPEGLYLLAEAYLKAGKVVEAKTTIETLDTLSAGDYRTLTGVGVLLARYHLYDEALRHLQSALQANPNSDEIKFDIAAAYFRKGLYPQALEAAQQISEPGRKDDACLSLMGDIDTHLGDGERAGEIFRDAIARNPDNDQDYLSLALLQLRFHQIAEAKQTLLDGQTKVPGSGKLSWGLGIAAALEGNTAEAGAQFERAVEMLPEWPGSYSMLGVFYFQTGQTEKAKEVLHRFQDSGESNLLDVSRIRQVLDQAPATDQAELKPMTEASKRQLLRLALSLADKTL